MSTISPGRAGWTLWSFRTDRATRQTINSGGALRAGSAVAAHPDLGRYLPGDPGDRDRHRPLVDDRRYLPGGAGHRDRDHPLIDDGRYLFGGPGHRDRYHPLIDDRRYLAAGDGDIGGNISHMKYLELL